METKQTRVFIKKMSLAIFFINSAIIILLSFGIYSVINTSIQEAAFMRLQNIAYLGAKTLDWDAFFRLREQLRENITPEKSKEIASSKDFKKIYRQLNIIKETDPDIIKYTYTFVPTKDKNTAQFVVDGDFFVDVKNHSSATTPFGEKYDISKQPLTKKALNEPVNVVDEKFSYDSPYNATVVTGFAPIFDSKNRFVGTFWVDISDKKLIAYAEQMLYLLIFFTGLAVVVALWISIKFNNYLIGLGFVIEEKKELETLLKKQKELDEKKTNFLNIASHELRAPLTVINGYLSMVIEWDFGELSPELKKYMTIAGQNSAYLLSLVNDMLDISKIDAGKENFVFENFNLFEVVQWVAGNAELMGKNKGVEIICNYRADKEDLIYSSKDALLRILINLMGNAVKFTDKGGTVKLMVEKNKRNYLFRIEDTGIGIEKSDFKKVFEKFGQAGNSLNKQNKGTGLWLYIVKKNIEALSGEIFLESTFGVGTVFTVKLPIESQ